MVYSGVVPQVSKRTLDKDIEERMFEIFWEAVAGLKKPAEVKEFLKDTLGPTEQIMLAKRLAIAVLLSKDYGYEDICSMLKVSNSTVSKIALWLHADKKGLKKVIKRIVAKKSFKKLEH